MNEGFSLSPDYFVHFMLVFFRLGSVVIFAPFFNHSSFPTILRISLALLLSLVIFPLQNSILFVAPTSIYIFFLDILRELLIGFTIGLSAQLIFTGIQFGGELISVQMGLSTATLLDPGQNQQTTLISQLYNLFALVIFISIGGHRLFVQSMVQTFDMIPLGDFYISANLNSQITTIFGQIYAIGFQISAPVFVASFLTTVAMALVTRAIPQINVFVIAPPFQIIIGFAMIIFSLRASVFMFQYLFEQMATNLNIVIQEISNTSFE